MEFSGIDISIVESSGFLISIGCFVVIVVVDIRGSHKVMGEFHLSRSFGQPRAMTVAAFASFGQRMANC